MPSSATNPTLLRRNLAPLLPVMGGGGAFRRFMDGFNNRGFVGSGVKGVTPL